VIHKAVMVLLFMQHTFIGSYCKNTNAVIWCKLNHSSFGLKNNRGESSVNQPHDEFKLEINVMLTVGVCQKN